MAKISLPLALLTLASRVICDQIIYPDQYEMMMKAMSTTPSYPNYAFPANNKRVEPAVYPASTINQAHQFNRESATRLLYTTPAPVYAPIAIPSSPPDWGSHVNCYRLYVFVFYILNNILPDSNILKIKSFTKNHFFRSL